MFYDKLKSICDQRGTYPSVVASQVGISSGTVSGWKSGASPRLDAVERIAAQLGITVSELLADREPEIDLQLFASPSPLGQDCLTLTPSEQDLIKAYREDPNLRAAIDAMLQATGHKKTDAAASLIS